MANQNALNSANAASAKAQQSYGLLMTADCGVRRADGAGGSGLQYLAQAVEHLAIAVAYFAQEQP